MDYLGVREVKVADLQRFPGNARLHAKERIRESVRKGQHRSIFCREIDDGTLVILAGNGTADAAQEVGQDTVRVEVVRCSDHEARWINVSDNQLSDAATNDLRLLADLVRAQGEDTAGLGFTDEQLAKLLMNDPMPGGGDAPTDGDLEQKWGVIIECHGEDEQVALLEELGGRGLAVRAFMQ